MLVICEDCGKKYNVDVSALKSGKGQFKCKKCGYLIVVNADDEPLLKAPMEGAKKAEKAAQSPQEAAAPKKDPDIVFTMPKTESSSTPQRGQFGGKGLTVGLYLILGLLVLFGSTAGIIIFLTQYSLPPILREQINLRTSAISRSFSGSVAKPLLVGNYLQINEETERVSKLPGVAYVAVVNKRGIVVAGSLGDTSMFNAALVQKYKNQGFPKEITDRNRIVNKVPEQEADIIVGGQGVHDVAVALDETGSEVHVGLFTSYINSAMRKLVNPMLYSLAALLIIGLLAFIVIGRIITQPIVELTEMANKISLGQLDLKVAPSGPAEVRSLALALERMRVSIQMAIKRLSK